MEKEIRVDTPAGAMKVFVAHTADVPTPVAIVYMDAIGYRDELKKIARRYANAGYYTVLPDLFHHIGDGTAFDIRKVIDEKMAGPESARLFDAIGRTTPELGEDFTRAILEHVEHDEAARSGSKVCLGFCMGARHALHAMSAFPAEFVAGCGIHPGVLVTDAPDSPHRELAGVRGEMYFGFAERDAASAPEILAAIEDEARRYDVALEIEVYSGTDHGFVMSDLPMFQEAASERHFERTLEVWERNTRVPV
jgi:carboxymethylenebutenolidase